METLEQTAKQALDRILKPLEAYLSPMGMVRLGELLETAGSELLEALRVAGHVVKPASIAAFPVTAKISARTEQWKRTVYATVALGDGREFAVSHEIDSMRFEYGNPDMALLYTSRATVRGFVDTIERETLPKLASAMGAAWSARKKQDAADEEAAAVVRRRKLPLP